jgi:hypothetical protein
MPIIVYKKRKPKKLMNTTQQISKLPLDELVTYEAFLWECLEKLPFSPTITTSLNAIHREVEWRAQDTEFK